MVLDGFYIKLLSSTQPKRSSSPRTYIQLKWQWSQGHLQKQFSGYLSTWVSGGHFVRRIPEPHLHHHRSRVATKVEKKKRLFNSLLGWSQFRLVTSKLLNIDLSKCSLWFKVPPPYHSFFRGRVMWRWLKIYPTSKLLSQWDFYNKNKSLRATKLNKWHDSLPTSKKTLTYLWNIPQTLNHLGMKEILSYWYFGGTSGMFQGPSVEMSTSFSPAWRNNFWPFSSAAFPSFFARLREIGV